MNAQVKRNAENLARDLYPKYRRWRLWKRIRALTLDEKVLFWAGIATAVFALFLGLLPTLYGD